MTQAQASDTRGAIKQHNGFDSLRLLGSFMVLFGHAFLVTSGSETVMIGTIPIHIFGVSIFFVISGFLITQSWMSDGHVGRYLMRRGLRIFPALFVVVTITAFIIGPLTTSESLGIYFRHGWTYRYVVSNAVLITVWGLPGVFDQLPLHGQVNGSLWTLPIEFALYLFTPVLVFLNHSLRRFGAILILCASLAVVIVTTLHPEWFVITVIGINLGWGIAIAPYFWIGSALRMLDLPGWPARPGNIVFGVAAVIFGAWAVLSSAQPILIALAIIPLALVVLSLGLRSWLYSATIERVGDLSYGIYLWAFPIQQLVMYEFGGGPVFNLAITVPATIVIAYTSWHLVERPALRFKPGRRTAHADEQPAVVSDLGLQSSR